MGKLYRLSYWLEFQRRGAPQELARFGGEHGFAALAGYPGVTPNVVAKLEGRLEGIGRVME